MVRVSGPPTFISQFLAPRLLPQPGLRIELVGEARQFSLSDGETDLALRMSRPVEKGIVARRLAVMAYGLYGSRDYLAGRGGDAQDFIGDDNSLDHLPQQRWLKMELWLLFHRDIGRTPAVRAVIDRITAMTTHAKAAFL